MAKVKIVEVGPRDGLQNEAKKLTTVSRIKYINQLISTGLKHIEVGAFVSPKWVPQMKNSHQVFKSLRARHKKKLVNRQLDLSTLVPNMKGMEAAVEVGVQHIAVFGATSETFSQRNINCSISESFKRFQDIANVAQKEKILMRGYLSTVFGCPYEGKMSEVKVLRCIERMFKLGVHEVSLSDTIGVATPKQVSSLLKKVDSQFGVKKIALHFHDTRGTALANVVAGLDQGVRTYDASSGGAGGCPYAKGASGNIATEDLVYMLEGMGHSTGVDIQKLIETSKWLEKRLGHALPSKVAKAGVGSIF